jgi:hypothetical protein
VHPALPVAFVAALLCAGAVAVGRARMNSGQHVWQEGAALTVVDIQRRLAEEKLRRLAAEHAAGRHRANRHRADHLFTHPHRQITPAREVA